MGTPLIPYIEIPSLPIAGPTVLSLFGHAVPVDISIKPFGTLVAIGCWIGSEAMMRTGRRMGLDAVKLSSFITSLLVWGFVGGHVLDSVFYHPDRVVAEPWSLLRIWDGQSSFGGFTGAFVGLWLWKVRHKASVLAYAEAVASGFPAGWVFGRMGCSVAHDHPGMLSDAWFAVRYPAGARFNLGLYEMLFTVPLALAFFWLSRKPRPLGFFNGVMCLAYAPTRFAFDFLRAVDVSEADPRYAGLTPAQWACNLLLAAGAYFTWKALRSAERGEWPSPPAPRVDEAETSGALPAPQATSG